MKVEEILNKIKNLKEVNNYQLTDIPSLFKIISLDLQLSQKNYILKTLP
jgi:hypothetical protein